MTSVPAAGVPNAIVPEQPPCVDPWQDTSDDPGLQLFTAVRREFGHLMPIRPGDAVLEIGSNETPWLKRAAATWPDASFLGLDWRAKPYVDGNRETRRVNALDPTMVEANSQDAIVSLSAFEHFGLGHYAQDPLDRDGDTHILANCWHWLKPGGWLYFDVPYDPRKYGISGTKYRSYDDGAVWDRLWSAPLAQASCSARWHWTGYVGAKHCDQLIEKPTTQADDRLHYYVAFIWQKVS